MVKVYCCQHHHIRFLSWKDYIFHHSNECQNWLKNKNVCTFLRNGRACGKFFKQTASLILHYFKIHDVYACSQCYRTFKSAYRLEAHIHNTRVNLRLNPYQCRYCDTSYDTAVHCLTHEDTHKGAIIRKSMLPPTKLCVCRQKFTNNDLYVNHQKVCKNKNKQPSAEVQDSTNDNASEQTDIIQSALSDAEVI